MPRILTEKAREKTQDIITKGKEHLKKKAAQIINETVQKGTQLINKQLTDIDKRLTGTKRKSLIASSILDNKRPKFSFKDNLPTINEILKIISEDHIDTPGKGIILD